MRWPDEAALSAPAQGSDERQERARLDAQPEGSEPPERHPTDEPPRALQSLLGAAAHNPSMRQLREATRHPGPIADFCVPVNSYFPTPQLLQRLQAALPDLLKHYPDTAPTHERHIARIAGVPAENVVVANGSTEVITALCQAARGPVVTTVPTFGRWTDLPEELGTPLCCVRHSRSRGWRIDADQLIATAIGTRASHLVLCNPNNPTGAWFTDAEIRRLAAALPQLDAIVVDESFIDFSDLGSAQQLAVDGGNVVVVKSLGKSLGWHGIRLGYAVASREAAARLRSRLPWWNVNGVAAFLLKELADDAALREVYAESFVRMAADRQHLLQRLRRVPGLTVYPSRANFLYAELPEGVSGKALRVELLEHHGLYVRECSNKRGSSESYLRLAVLPPAESDRLGDALEALLPLHAGPNR